MQGSCSSSDVKAPPVQTSKSKKKKKEEKAAAPPDAPAPPAKKQPDKVSEFLQALLALCTFRQHLLWNQPWKTK